MKQANDSEFKELLDKYLPKQKDSDPEQIFSDVVSDGYSLLTASSIVSKIYDLTLSEARKISQIYWEKHIKPKDV